MLWATFNKKYHALGILMALSSIHHWNLQAKHFPEIGEKKGHELVPFLLFSVEHYPLWLRNAPKYPKSHPLKKSNSYKFGEIPSKSILKCCLHDFSVFSWPIYTFWCINQIIFTIYAFTPYIYTVTYVFNSLAYTIELFPGQRWMVVSNLEKNQGRLWYI